MDSDGRIYASENPKPEDVERLKQFAEKDLETQLQEWRDVIAGRQAERERKDAAE